MSPAPTPVFVDDSGRRRTLTRAAGRVLVAGFAAYLGLVVVGFAGHPRVGPIQMPTFGVPGIGLAVPPTPSVLGEQTSRNGSGADELELATGGPSAPPTAAPARPGPPDPSPDGAHAGGGDQLTSASGGHAPGPVMTPVGDKEGSETVPAPPSTTTTSRQPVIGPEPSATTTTTVTPSSTTTSSTPSTTSTSTPTTSPGADGGSGAGSGRGEGPVSAKGPGGEGPPGQQRKSTTSAG